MNDLRVNHVRLGLENSIAFTRAKASFPVQVTADCLHFLCVKRLKTLSQARKFRGSFKIWDFHIYFEYML